MALARAYIKIHYPSPKALGRVLPDLCVVDADEILGLEHEMVELANMAKTLPAVTC